VSLTSRHIKGKKNKVDDALTQSIQKIHLETTSVGESDIHKKINILLQEDDFFIQVKEKFQQGPKEKRQEGY
jgi:hypothetical protein